MKLTINFRFLIKLNNFTDHECDETCELAEKASTDHGGLNVKHDGPEKPPVEENEKIRVSKIADHPEIRLNQGESEPDREFLQSSDSCQVDSQQKCRVNGNHVKGNKVRITFPESPGKGKGASDTSSSRRRGRGRMPAHRRSDYRVHVSRLPRCGSWQDLKDHMRVAGEVCFTDVFHNGCGVVEYTRFSDMKKAIQTLNNSRFESHVGGVSYVRVARFRSTKPTDLSHD